MMNVPFEVKVRGSVVNVDIFVRVHIQCTIKATRKRMDREKRWNLCGGGKQSLDKLSGANRLSFQCVKTAPFLRLCVTTGEDRVFWALDRPHSEGNRTGRPVSLDNCVRPL